MVELADLSQVLQEGDSDKVVELVQKALEDKIEPMEIINKGLLPTMDVIGEKFGLPYPVPSEAKLQVFESQAKRAQEILESNEKQEQ